MPGGTSKEDLEKLEQQIDYTPSKINKEWREFLIMEYSAKAEPANSREDA